MYARPNASLGKNPTVAIYIGEHIIGLESLMTGHRDNLTIKLGILIKTITK